MQNKRSAIKKSTFRRRPSAKGERKSTIAKKRAARRIDNPVAKSRLSKRHPRTPERRGYGVTWH
jgi:hypothetical protein